MYIGDFDKARMLAEEGLRTAQLAEDAACLRFSYFLLGQAARGQAKFDDAASFYTRAVALSKEAGDSHNFVIALANFGQLNFLHGRYEAAAVMYREALAAARDASSRLGLSYCLTALTELFRCLASQSELRDCSVLSKPSENEQAGVYRLTGLPATGT